MIISELVRRSGLHAEMVRLLMFLVRKWIFEFESVPRRVGRDSCLFRGMSLVVFVRGETLGGWDLAVAVIVVVFVVFGCC